MWLDSLGIEYDGELVVTDVDDCLIATSESIERLGFRKSVFYFSEDVYQANKDNVFNGAVLTDWGKEFVRLVSNGTFKDSILLTAAGDRLSILSNRFGTNLIMEDMEDFRKVMYLNDIDVKTIYVDDKKRMSKMISNNNVKVIIYKA